jgi:hypothetical protein
MKASKVLRRAIGLIDKGWVQGAAASAKDGGFSYPGKWNAKNFCMLGAVEHSTFPWVCGKPFGIADYHANTATRLYIIDALDQLYPSKYGIISFNDEYGRTQNEVLRVLQRALTLAEADECLDEMK